VFLVLRGMMDVSKQARFILNIPSRAALIAACDRVPMACRVLPSTDRDEHPVGDLAFRETEPPRDRCK